MNEIEIIIKSMDDYLIKSPMGIFKDINDAIDNYPFLEEHKQIKKCKLCGKWFIKYGKENNNRKYCSDKCSKKAHSNQSKDSIYNKTFTENSKYNPNQFPQYLKDSDNREKYWEFNQDDTYWGLGSSGLSEHKTSNFLQEQRYIKRELKRLGLR
jgi:hypothetical protein